MMDDVDRGDEAGMTIEETLNELENNSRHDIYSLYDKEIADMVIDALEKQVPKKPVMSDIGNGIKSPMCPICNSGHIFGLFGTFRHCSNCGQRLDWRDKDGADQ